MDGSVKIEKIYQILLVEDDMIFVCLVQVYFLDVEFFNCIIIYVSNLVDGIVEFQ